MRHPNRLLTAAVACIALIVILTGVAVAQVRESSAPATR